MKKCNLIILASAAVLLTGCLVTSVYPFYHQKDLLFEPALLGDWTNSKETDEHWKFERENTNAYRLTWSSDGKSSAMSAHFFKLGDTAFLDLFTTEEMKDVQPPPIPAHFLIRVFRVAPEPKMASLNYEWLETFLKQEPAALRHHRIVNETNSEDCRLVLTADTTELQKFLLAHLKTEEAWKNDFELKRDAAGTKSDANK